MSYRRRRQNYTSTRYRQKSSRRKTGKTWIGLIFAAVLVVILNFVYLFEWQQKKGFWEQLNIPEYAGEPYAVVHENEPFFTPEELAEEPYERYSPLDGLGRCGVAMAMLDPSLLPTEERGEIGSVKPSGWIQARYDGVVNSNPGYLYNRCHLLAFCLTGENANERNLITGTRYMNIEGMLPFEEQLVQYVEGEQARVLYRVTPLFEGNNLVASGVLLEAYSVEDGGEDICFCIFCYNVQPGVEIDYKTGESWLLE